MTIRDLEIFVTVVEAGTMSAAAKKLKISQPSISQSIAQVEQEYNIVLFDRVSRKLFLTATGRKLLEYAQGILKEIDDMKSTLLLSPTKSTFAIGASLSVDTTYLQRLMNSLDEVKGDTPIQIIMEDSTTLSEKIKKKELHVAIMEGTDFNPEGWHSELLFEDRLYFICHPDHPLANRSSVTIRDLRNQPFAIREKGTKAREFIMSMLREEMVPVELTWVCPSYESIFSVVECGHGVSVVPGCTVSGNKNLVAIPFEGTIPNCNFRLISREDSTHPEIMETCLREIRNIFQSH